MNENSLPLVSIIIPVYNRAYCIRNCLNSVLQQTYLKTEIIVVDDGSNDNLKEVLESYKSQIIYLYQNNKGQSSARNLGLSHAKGEYIAPLDSDDIWNKDYLENAISEINKNGYDVFISNWEHYNTLFKASHLPNAEIYSSYELFREKIFQENLGANSGMVIHKQIINKGWNEKIRIGDDWYLLIQLIVDHVALKIGFCPEPCWIKSRFKDNVCDGVEGWKFRLKHLKDIDQIINDFRYFLNYKEICSLNVKKFQNILLLTIYNFKFIKYLTKNFTNLEMLKLFLESSTNFLSRFRRIYVRLIS